MANNSIDLMDYERIALDKFIIENRPSDKDIENFLQILRLIREQPNKNPQLKKGKIE